MRRRRGAESIAVMASHLEIDRFTVSGRWIGALAALACGCLLAAAPTASAQFVVATNANGRLRLVAPKRPRKALASASYRLRRGGGTTVALRLGGIRARTLVTIAGGLGPTGRPHVTVRRLTNR
jgi:hypothetical protein